MPLRYAHVHNVISTGQNVKWRLPTAPLHKRRIGCERILTTPKRLRRLFVYRRFTPVAINLLFIVTVTNSRRLVGAACSGSVVGCCPLFITGRRERKAGVVSGRQLTVRDTSGVSTSGGVYCRLLDKWNLGPTNSMRDEPTCKQLIRSPIAFEFICISQNACFAFYMRISHTRLFTKWNSIAQWHRHKYFRHYRSYVMNM